MSQWEPVPILSEDKHSNDCLQVSVTSAGLQAQSDVATTTVDDALSENCTELGHRVFMFAADDLRIQLSEESNLRTCLVGVLNQNHCWCDLRRKKGGKYKQIITWMSSRWRMKKTLTNAPWRTKLTGSNFAIGSKRAIASRKPVPAQAIPRAMAAP